MIPTFKRVVTLCFFAVAAILAASEPVSAQTCDNVTDEQLVNSVYAKIKADKGLASQISHINVVSVYGAVKFQGWANSKSDFDKVVEFAVTTSCVKLVNVNLFEEIPPPANYPLRSASGCASGTKPCGDVCIPQADTCNITGR